MSADRVAEAPVSDRLMALWNSQGRLLRSLGYSVGQWTEHVSHVDPCDCDEGEETAGHNCMANSEWSWALMRDGGAFADEFVMALSDTRTGPVPGEAVLG